MLTIRRYATLPPIVNGYELDDQFSVVVPVARTNLCQNPSFETNTTNWTAIGGSIARTTAQQYHGAYSLAITPTAATTDGARFDTVSLTAGSLYAYSAKVLGQAGRTYRLALETTGAVELASVVFVATGRWQWIVGYYAETSTTTRRLTVRKSGGTDILLFYIDGAQVEAIAAGELASTYIDGSQQGFVPNQNPVAYYWNGTPHASTSARSGLTRAGGMVIPFKQFGFLLAAVIGLGMAAPQNTAVEYARIDGGYDDFTRKPTRQFTLSGQIQGGLDYLQLRQYRGGLGRLFDRDLVAQDQRLLLKREVIDPCGTVQSGTCQIPAKYQSGLPGNTDNQVSEQVALTFVNYLPAVLADGESGGALTVQLSVTNAKGIVQRSAAGVWSSLGTGLTAGVAPEVSAIARGLDGSIYVGGAFTDAGSSGADNIAKWDGTTWSVLGSATALNGPVLALAVGPDGALYVGGGFTNASGIAAADYIAKWDGSVWTALGTGASALGNVHALAFGPDGTLYAGGEFTSMGGVANTAGIAKWDGSVWTAMGTGAGAGGVSAIATRGTTVIAGGGFVSMGGVANTNGLAKWNGSVWASMTTGMVGGQPFALAFGPNNLLYIGGSFTTISGLSLPYLVQWNGVSFTGGAPLNGLVQAIAIESTGVVHIGGQFTTVNGITFPDRMAKLIGQTFVPEDIDLPGVALIESFLALGDGTLYVGGTYTGTASAAGVTTITNPGTARSYPIIIINGPSSGTARIYSIVNYTTGRGIYLNLTLSLGEVATLVFTPDNLSFQSTFQGDISSTIMGGSNTADFFLQPGANSIAFLSASSTVVATLYYRPAFINLDDVP